MSVHGATVGYKAEALKQVFAYLNGREWLNDDVVIPLTLRALFPQGVLLYPAGEVLDKGIAKDARDGPRRQRILTGNLQWAGYLLPDCFRRNPVAGLLAMRRLFRVLWAYWLALATLSLALINPFLAMGVSFLILGAIVFGSGRDLAQAARVSFLAPFHLAHNGNTLQGAWK